MLDATRAAALVAVLALTGTLALVAGPFDRFGDEVAPAAPAWTAEDVVPVVGHSAHRGQAVPGSVEVTPERVMDHGGTIEYELTSDDPRFDGAMLLTINIDSILGATGASVFRGSVEVDAEDGEWVGTVQGVGLVGTNDMHSQIVLSGTGAYEGLSAVLIGDNTENEIVWRWTGMVFPGEMPEYPE